MPIRFQFRLIPFVMTVLLVSLGIVLAQWQMRRADDKQIIKNTLLQRSAAAVIPFSSTLPSVEQLEYRHLSLRGEFIADWAVYLDNRPLNGVAGFYVLMPFKIVGAERAVLVVRGWLPRDPAIRDKLLPYITPVGTIEIIGMVRRNFSRVLQLGDAGVLHPQAIIQNIDIKQFSEDSQLKLEPFILEQTSALEDGLLRVWPSPALGIEKHRAYALQWYALAVMACIFFVITGFRRGTKNKPADE